MTAEFVPLGKLITVIRNGLNTAQYDEPVDDGMLPISRIETISEGVIDFERVKYARVSEAERRKYQLRSGDILFSHINSPAHIGKTAIFRSDQVLIHGVNLLLLRLDLERCYPEYLNYYLKSFEVRAWFRARCKKAVNQASLNQSDIKLVEAPLPPLPEQKRIAAILVKADRLRRLRRFARDLSDTYLQSVFLEMFGDPVTNPMGWEIKEVETQIKSIRYGTGSPPEYRKDGIAFIRATNIKRGTVQQDDLAYISETDARSIAKCKVNAGDLIIVRSGVNTGDCALIPREFDGAYAAYDLIIQVPYPQNYYYNFIINSDYGKSIIRPLSRRAGQPHINADQVKSLRFPVPPMPLQEEFAHIVRQFERLRAQQREAQRQAEHLFQTLLHRAFRGEL